MLTLGRYAGQSVQLTDKQGYVVNVHVQLEDRNGRKITDRSVKVVLSFEDDDRNFDIQRPDRKPSDQKPESIQLGSFSVPTAVVRSMRLDGAVEWGAINKVDLYTIRSDDMIVGNWNVIRQEYTSYDHAFFPTDWTE